MKYSKSQIKEIVSIIKELILNKISVQLRPTGVKVPNQKERDPNQRIEVKKETDILRGIDLLLKNQPIDFKVPGSSEMMSARVVQIKQSDDYLKSLIDVLNDVRKENGESEYGDDNE